MGGGAQWANLGGQAQIKELTELASYTPQFYFNGLLKKNIIKYVKIAGFLASFRPTTKRN